VQHSLKPLGLSFWPDANHNDAQWHRGDWARRHDGECSVLSAGLEHCTRGSTQRQQNDFNAIESTRVHVAWGIDVNEGCEDLKRGNLGEDAFSFVVVRMSMYRGGFPHACTWQ
jgi:hypothetical protein